MLLAESTSQQFLPPLHAGRRSLCLLAACAAAVLAARLAAGAGQSGRAAVEPVELRAAILPDRRAGASQSGAGRSAARPVQRPEIFYLLDASASMQMGNPRSRWDESLAMIRAAQQRSPRRRPPSSSRSASASGWRPSTSRADRPGVPAGSRPKITPASIECRAGDKSQARRPDRRRHAPAGGPAADFQPLRPRAAAGDRACSPTAACTTKRAWSSSPPSSRS